MNYSAPSDRRRGLPLRVDPAAAAETGATSFVRAIASSLIAADRSEPPERVARALWPNDTDARLVIKAASAPATLGTPSWAGVVGHMQVADLIALLAPSSVAAAMLSRCLRLSWPIGVAQILIPTISVNPDAAAWVAEGAPAPVFDFISSSVALTPKKIATACIFSREMAASSDIEQLLRVALSESLGLMLDVTLLGTAAGDTATPTGIFNGLTPLAASSQTIASEAMSEDVSRLIATVAVVAGNNPIILVMSPRQAASMRVRRDIDFETFSSAALADGTVAALAVNALISIGDPTPEFSATAEASFHTSTTPADIVSIGGTVAGPGKSLWQTDCLALRMKCSLNWALRSPNGAALIQNVIW